MAETVSYCVYQTDQPFLSIMQNNIIAKQQHQNQDPMHGEKDRFKPGLEKKNVLYTSTDTKPIPVPIPIQKSKEIVVCERCTLQSLYLYNLYLYLYLHKTCTYSYSYSKI